MADFPVFNFNSSAFPILTPQQTSPLGGVLADAIAKRLALAKAEEAEAGVPYAGLTKLSDILSKSAYANAVLPQAQMKLLGVPGAVANLKYPQTTLNRLESYGQTGSTGNPLQDYINSELVKISAQEQQKSRNQNVLGRIGQGIKNLFMGQEEPQQVAQQAAQPTPQYLATQPVSNNEANRGAPLANEPTPAWAEPLPPLPANKPNQAPDTSGRTPESIAWTEAQAKHEQELAESKETGTKRGGIRQQQIEDFETTQETSTNYLNVIHDMNQTISNPVFQEIMSTPFVSQHSLKWYAETGTPEQQNLVGKFLAEQPQLVANYVQQFRGNMNLKEIALGESTKVNPNDKPQVMIGKMESLNRLVEIQNQVSYLAAKYMAENPKKSKHEALKYANSAINKDEIIKNIDKELHPDKEQFYAKNIDEWHNGKSAEETKTVNGKRMLKIGGKWYQED